MFCSRFHRLNQRIEPFLDLPGQCVQQIMLFLLRERGKDVIEQRGGRADKMTSASFHGGLWTRPYYTGSDIGRGMTGFCCDLCTDDATRETLERSYRVGDHAKG